MSQSPWIGKTLGGRYEIVEAIGKGGQGALFKAKQKGLERDVAVKLIRLKWEDNEEALKRFEREAKVIAKLNHPNVIQIFDFDRSDDGTCFIVMELVEGQSLHQVLNTKNLDWNQSAEIVRQVAQGLGKVHNAGIVHRDIKPANIMLAPSDNGAVAKVLDFGIALTNDPNEGAMTETGIIVGTPGYLAPELTRTGKGDGRADLYSLGVVWFEMLTKKLPITGETPMEIVFKTASQDIAPLTTLAPALAGHPYEPVLYRLLSRDPLQRFANADEVVAAIDAVRRGEQVTAPVPNVAAAAPVSLVAEPPITPSAGPVTNPTPGTAAIEAPIQTPVQTVVVQNKNAIGPIGIVLGIALVAVLIGGAFLFGRERQNKEVIVEKRVEVPVEKIVERVIERPVVAAAKAEPVEAPAPVAKLAAKAKPLATRATKKERVAALSTNKTKKLTPTKSKVLSDKSAASQPVKSSEPKKVSKYTSALLQSVIKKNLGTSDSCQNTVLQSPGNGVVVFDHCPTFDSIAGSQLVNLEISPAGKVVSASFKNRKLNSDKLGKCALKDLRGFEFPPFEGSANKVIGQRLQFNTCTIIDGDCVR